MPPDSEYGLQIPQTQLEVMTGVSVDDYQRLDPRKHAFRRADMYIGDLAPRETECLIFPEGQTQSTPAKITYSSGLLHLIKEIVANSIDNISKTRHINQTNPPGFIDPGNIEINLNQELVNVKSYGQALPVEYRNKMDPNSVTVPEFVFGDLMTSSNYGTKYARTGVGANGVGAKIVAIMSKWFVVEVNDVTRQAYGQYRWIRNMERLDQAVLHPPHHFDPQQGWVKQPGSAPYDKNFVSITWAQDFRQFGHTSMLDILPLVRMMAVHLSFINKVIFSVNGQTLDYRAPEKFVECIAGKVKFYHHLKWPAGQESVTTAKDWTKVYQGHLKLPDMEMLCIDAPNPEFKWDLSAVNGMITDEGGTHVTALREAFNERIKNGPVKELTAKFGDTIKITAKDYGPLYMAFCAIRIENPVYKGQVKAAISNKIPKITLPEDINFKGWTFISRLMDEFNRRYISKVNEVEKSKKGREVISGHGEHANLAGQKPELCSMIVAEGMSAAGYCNSMASFATVIAEDGKTYRGKDVYGFIDLKGKPPNCTGMLELMIHQKNEFAKIMKHLGLKHGVDYTKPEHAKSLKYGSLWIMTDADKDGHHICMLLINFIYRSFPSFVASGRLKILLTPVVTLFHRGTRKETFFFEQEFFEYLKAHQGRLPSNYETVYYKGLAAHTNEDIKYNLQHGHFLLTCQLDEGTPRALDMAFKKTSSDLRKDKIREYQQSGMVIPHVEVRKMLAQGITSGVYPISSMIGSFWVGYALDTLDRSIFSALDGFKESQRKLMYYMLRAFNYGDTSKKAIKIERIAAQAAEKTLYHHGATSLEGAATKMAQEYVGTNNLNLLLGDGQQGSRAEYGKDAGAGRYVGAKLTEWCKYIFHREMVDLVPRRDIDGEKAEPHFIPCDLPLHLINGGKGLSVGYLSNIPQFHPIEIAHYIIAALQGEPLNHLFPFYRGFTGDIIMAKTPISLPFPSADSDPGEENGSRVASPGPDTSMEEALGIIEDEVEEDPEAMEAQTEVEAPKKVKKVSGPRFYTKGSFSMDLKGKTAEVLITELPINHPLAPKFYKKWLEEMAIKSQKKDEKTPITFKSVIDESTDPNMVRLRLTGVTHPTGMDEIFKKLGMVTSISLNNIICIDGNSIPNRYNRIYDLLHFYINNMLGMYDLYRGTKLEKLNADLEHENQLVRLINAILEGRIDLRATEEQLTQDLIREQVSQDVFDGTSLKQFKASVRDAHLKKICGIQEAIDTLTQTSPAQLWINNLYKFIEFADKVGYPLRTNPVKMET